MSEPAWVPIGPAAVLDVGPEVAYQEFTASVSVTATTEATAQTVVTAPAFAADGNSQYLIEFFAPQVNVASGVQNQTRCVLFLDGVAIGEFGTVVGPVATAITAAPIRSTRRLTPAAGSRVFSVRAYVGSGTGTIIAGAGGAAAPIPGFIRITKVPSAVPGPSGLVPPTALVTSLPASPVDGQEIILTDSLTAPTYAWRLRYLAAKATNKWLFIGGSPLSHFIDTGESLVTGGAIQDLATDGPKVTIPVAGDYLVDVRVGYQTVTAASSNITYLYINGVQLANYMTTPGGPGYGGASHTGARVYAIGAGHIAKIRYQNNGGGRVTAQFAYRSINVLPVAIGG